MEKTTKFAPSIIALGNMSQMKSRRPSRRKAIPQPSEEITNSMMYLKTNCCFDGLWVPKIKI